MTKSQWSEMTKKFNEEKIRLHNLANNQAMALILIGKVEELTGDKMSLNDAIEHLAKVKIFS